MEIGNLTSKEESNMKLKKNKSFILFISAVLVFQLSAFSSVSFGKTTCMDLAVYLKAELDKAKAQLVSLTENRSTVQKNTANIEIQKTEHGRVSVMYKNDKAVITLSPDRKYITASADLISSSGKKLKLTKEKTNVYTCSIPETQSTLKVQFRRARVMLNKDELAMSKGETSKVSWSFQLLDGYTNTRSLVKNPLPDDSIKLSSSDSSVVKIDRKGNLKALKKGYARITAEAAAGNGISDYFYVIVDGEKSEVLGTITFLAFFDIDQVIQGLAEQELGHSMIIFENKSGHDVKIKTGKYYECNLPTPTYYKAVREFTGEGYDPVTFYSLTDGKFPSEENEAARTELRHKLFTCYEKGKLKKYTVKNNDIAEFGNTSEDDYDTVVNTLLYEDGDFPEVLDRYQGREVAAKVFGLVEEAEKNEISAAEFVKELRSLGKIGKELIYDLNHGFMPINGVNGGGVCLNWEMEVQTYDHYFSNNMACQTEITQLQLDALMDYYQYNNYFSMLEENCTMSAAGAWNLVTADNSKFHITPNIGGITKGVAAPLWAKKKIKKMSSSPKLKKYVKSGEIRFFKNIPVVKKGMFDKYK